MEELRELQTVLEAKQAKIGEFELELNKSQQHDTNRGSMVEELEKTVATLQANIVDIKEKHEDQLKSKFGSLNQDLEMERQKAKNLEMELNEKSLEFNQTISELESRLASQEEDIQEEANSVQALEESLREATTNLEQQSGLLEVLVLIYIPHN